MKDRIIPLFTGKPNYGDSRFLFQHTKSILCIQNWESDNRWHTYVRWHISKIPQAIKILCFVLPLSEISGLIIEIENELIDLTEDKW